MVDHDPKLSELRDELRRLPAPRAGEGFTHAVMARLDAAQPAEPWLGLPRLVMVATAVVAVAVALSPTFREPFPGGGGGGASPPTVAGDTAGPAGLASGVPAGETTAPQGTPPFDRLRAGRSGGPDGEKGAATTAPESVPRAPGDGTATGGRNAGGAASPSRETAAPPSSTPSAPTATERGAEGPGGAAVDDGYRPDRRVVRVTERPAAEIAAAGAAPAAADAARSVSTRQPASRPAALDAGEREQALRRLAELRREQRQLGQRLTALAALAAPESAPALLLGGDESMELVLDLDAGAPSAGGVRPASYRPGEPPGHR
jgi:hypothetical protein